MRQLELLAPAGNADIALQAIRHGADAVYIGAPSHGARKSAANSIEDIKRVVDFAHIFNAKVYVTLNTIIYESELRSVERMIRELYAVGVDALIVQDMGILRMDIPPIALHASTQCDIRTPGKARFLQEAGFSQLVLARELSVDEIRAVCDAVSVPVEVFVHGALCVSYSGRCSAGFVCGGRSGNRGECPQVCRLPFTLTDASGKVLAKDKYLLSLKDFNAGKYLESLVEAGVSSFKIEGRMKEAGYVKNVTAHYSRRLDEIVEAGAGTLRRESYGRVDLSFTPEPVKSFNRGFTSYRLSGSPAPEGIASILTPKSLGEPVADISMLRPGDGVSYFDRKGEYKGVQVNGVANGKILSNKPFRLPPGAEIRRTSSIEWKKLMASETAVRRLALNVEFDAMGVSATDETGAMVRLPHTMDGQPADKPTDYGKVFSKLGNTPFRLDKFENLAPELFFPVSYLSSLRRELVDKLLEAKRAAYRFDYRKPENPSFNYFTDALDYRDNVANSLAEKFYIDHGVTKLQPALETSGVRQGLTVMTSRHCILRELGLCLKNNPGIKLPLLLESGKMQFVPQFDCASCKMHIRTK